MIIKIILMIMLIFHIGGCGKLTAEDTVVKLMQEYNDLSNDVLEDINEVVNNSNLDDEQKEIYKEVIERQYRDLKYEIKNAIYEGSKATVEVKITVYDYYGVQKNAIELLARDDTEFRVNGKFSNKLFMDYKLEMMRDTSEVVEYTIFLDVLKDDNKRYYVAELSQENLEKIHGIYNYDND